MWGRSLRSIACTTALFVFACDEAKRPAEQPAPGPEAGSAFDRDTAGSVTGRVTWKGDVPKVGPFRAPVSPLSEQSARRKREWPNPYAPRIDPATRGLAGCVVLLRGVDPAKSRPWDHPPVTVEMRDFALHVHQGDGVSSTGFVRRGSPVTFQSTQDVLDTLHVRGVAFFALAFPASSSRPITRTLSSCGIVELSSGAGHFWMQANLFVEEHPYLACTRADGSFSLALVPPGEYEVECWCPDWHEAEHELDADTGLVMKLRFRAPVTLSRKVRVAPHAKADVRFTLDADQFGR